MTIPHPHIHSMAPYALADLRAPKGRHMISLSQNESLRPPSPKVSEAVLNSLSKGMLYPDPVWTELRQALALTHNVSSGHILCGNGSLTLITALAHVFAGPERSVLAPVHAYPYFRTAAETAGARFDTALEHNATASVSAMLDAVLPDTGMVCVANPGNPTGTRIPKADLLQFRQELRSDILLVIDEAYGEFADHLGERCFDMVEGGNTVVLRTFSKAYGMAGYRVGWGLFPEPIGREIHKVLTPNNVAYPTQVAALAALEDHDYMLETCTMTTAIREQVAADLQAAGFKVFPSFTNFILMDCRKAEIARNIFLE